MSAVFDGLTVTEIDGFPVSRTSRCRDGEKWKPERLRETVAGFGLDDAAGADQFGERVA